MQITVLADDFTGALDTGIQLAQKGMRTAVCSLPERPFWEEPCDVLVIDTQTRHLPPEDAGRMISSLARRAREAGSQFLYKKTDSTLRGNIGSELCGALEGFGEKRLAFVPAYPELGRTTRGMIHRVDGVPLDQTVYARDALNPVHSSRVDKIIAEQCGMPVVSPFVPPPPGRYILLYDWTVQAEGHAILKDVCRRKLRVLGGCAGFAEYLDQLIRFTPHVFSRSARTKKIFLVSGSVHPQSLLQLKTAQKAGWPLVELPSALKNVREYPQENALWQDTLSHLRHHLSQEGRTILAASTHRPDWNDESPEMRESQAQNISSHLGQLARQVLQSEPDCLLVIFGGDTAAKVVHACGGEILYPLFRVLEGIPYCEFHAAFSSPQERIGLITKAGGFGPQDLLLRLEKLFGKG